MFEYLAYEITIFGYNKSIAIQNWLDQIGEQNWELITIEPVRENCKNGYVKDKFVYFVIMKRLKIIK